jgi:CheY-like chemotaxis protein
MNKTILIVDDKEDIREIIKMVVSTINDKCVIIECHNGEEAVVKYKEHNPDLVFMDMRMPIMDGYTAITEIEKYDVDSYKKMFIISAIAKSGGIQSIIESGKVSGSISKPPDINDLIEILKRVI